MIDKEKGRFSGQEKILRGENVSKEPLPRMRSNAGRPNYKTLRKAARQAGA